MDPIITLEVVIILPMLLMGMILITIQLLEHELVIPMDMTNLLIAVVTPQNRGVNFFFFATR